MSRFNAHTGLLQAPPGALLDDLYDAVATQHTVTQIISAIRLVRNQIPRPFVESSGAMTTRRAKKPVIDWSDAEERDGLISALVTDVTALLDAVDDESLDQDQADAIGLFALVSAQTSSPGRQSRQPAHRPSARAGTGSSRSSTPRPATATSRCRCRKGRVHC